MDKLWVVIKREYLERVRSKWFIFTTVFGPLFFGAITILPSYMGMRTIKVLSPDQALSQLQEIVGIQLI